MAKNVSVYNIIRQLVQEEVQRIFSPDQKFTSLADRVTLSEEPTRSRKGRRKRGSRASSTGIRGRVTSTTDKRLKANREL